MAKRLDTTRLIQLITFVLAMSALNTALLIITIID